MNYIFLILCLLCQSQSWANADSLVDAVIKIKKPYLIINLTREDCIVCKSNAINILTSICPEKLVVLSDDRLMKPYLEKNAEMLSKLPFIYNKVLSGLLAKGASSTACLVDSSGIDIFVLDAQVDNNLRRYKEVLNKNCDSGLLSQLSEEDKLNSTYLSRKSGKYTAFTDSVFNNYGSVFAIDANTAYLFNEKFQIGLTYKLNTKEATYVYPALDTNLQKRLHMIVNVKSPIEFYDVAYSNELLKYVALPPLIINSNKADNVCFYYGMAYNKSGKKDTTLNVGIRKQCFFAWDLKNEAPFNIGSYNSYCWLDSIHYNNDAFVVDPGYGYEIAEKVVYFPVLRLNATGQLAKVPEINIGNFYIKSGEKAKIKNIHTISFNSKTPSDFFFHIDEGGVPVVADKENREIILREGKEKIKFEELYTHGKDTLVFLYDFAISKDQISFVGVLNSKVNISGVYSLNTRKADIKVINSESIYSGAKIYGNKIVAYKKNEEIDELYFEQFYLR